MPPGSSVTGTLDGQTTIVHGQDVTATESWGVSHTHLVPGPIAIRDLLIVAPGTRVVFGAGAGLVVPKGGSGNLYAAGSPGAPIRFDSAAASPAAGDWAGIDLEGGTRNTLDQAVVAHAGKGRAAVHVHEGSVIRLTDATISASAGDGLQVDAGATIWEFARNAFLDNAAYPVALNPDLVGGLDAQSVFVGNGKQAVRFVAFGGELTEIKLSQTWPRLSVPYSWPKPLQSIESRVVLEPGVKILFDPGSRLRIYEAGALVVAGTAADPVVMDSAAASPSAGDWEGLRFDYGVHDLRHLEIRHAGKNGVFRNADIVVGGRGTNVTLANCRLLEGSGYGILVEDIATASWGPDTFIDLHPLGVWAPFKFQLL